jgi:hypothetical protein
VNLAPTSASRPRPSTSTDRRRRSWPATIARATSRSTASTSPSKTRRARPQRRGPGKRQAVASRLPHHYGYIRRTDGADGQHVDVFVGPHLKSPRHLRHRPAQHPRRPRLRRAQGVHRLRQQGSQARAAYHRAFSDGRGKERIGHVERMSVDGFKDWLRDGDTKQAIKRAAGGRVGYAEGGAPAFDQTSELPAFDQTEPVKPQGRLDRLHPGRDQRHPEGDGALRR